MDVIYQRFGNTVAAPALPRINTRYVCIAALLQDHAQSEAAGLENQLASYQSAADCQSKTLHINLSMSVVYPSFYW